MNACAAPSCESQERKRRYFSVNGVTQRYCPKHYFQLWRHGRLTPESEQRNRGRGCLAPGCARKHASKGYCNKHRAQILRHGKLTPWTEHSKIRDEVRSLYASGDSIRTIALAIGHSWITVKKNVSDLIPRKRIVSDERVLSLYRATGQTKRVSSITGLSKVTIWRRLVANGVEIGHGATTWKSLYGSIRAKVIKSEWRKKILDRDNYKCVTCGDKTTTVHHKTKLADIRDKVLREHPGIDPFNSAHELKLFSNLVIAEHEGVEGITLCSRCHSALHGHHCGGPRTVRKAEPYSAAPRQ